MTGKKGMINKGWGHRLSKSKDPWDVMMSSVYRLKKMKKIRNAILENCAYHDVNITEQTAKLVKRGRMTTEEERVIQLSWEYQTTTAKNLMLQLQELLEGDKKVKGKNKTKGNKKEKQKTIKELENAVSNLQNIP